MNTIKTLMDALKYPEAKDKMDAYPKKIYLKDMITNGYNLH